MNDKNYMICKNELDLLNTLKEIFKQGDYVYCAENYFSQEEGRDFDEDYWMDYRHKEQKQCIALINHYYTKDNNFLKEFNSISDEIKISPAIYLK